MPVFTVIGLTVFIAFISIIIQTLLTFFLAVDGKEKPLEASYVVIVLLALVISIFIVVMNHQEGISENSCSYNEIEMR